MNIRNIFYCLTLISMTFSNTYAWTFLDEIEGIRLYTKESKDGTIPFKAHAIIKGNVEDFYTILKDFKSKHKWAPKLKSVKLHTRLKEDDYIFSEYYKTPWPAYDREFLLKGSIKKIDSGYIFEAKSVDDHLLIDNDHVQAYVPKLKVIIMELNQKETDISFEFHGDMKGWLPNWLKNIIQKKWPVRFIQSLEEQNKKDTYE